MPSTEVLKTSKTQTITLLQEKVVNSLSPDINMHVLLTALHTFLMELVRRICLNIKRSCPW